MGQSVKVTTRTADSPYVHELALVAAELEQRYKDSKVGCNLVGLVLFTVKLCPSIAAKPCPDMTAVWQQAAAPYMQL